MTITSDKVALDQWYAIERIEAITTLPHQARLLGQDILAQRDQEGAVKITVINDQAMPGRELPTQERYGHVWTTLGSPRDLFEIPEFAQPERRLITCGAVKVHTSAPRIVENFLDLSHFPYVHTDILGAEPNTEVESYRVEFKEDCDEVWAYDCQFHQPRAAASANEGILARYQYRVATPFVVMLYKCCPIRPEENDVLGLFIQPIEEDVCDVHSFVLVFDETNDDVDLLHFQQTIFLQDRSILENQIPKRLPLKPGSEIPIKADATSMAYRRWLRKSGLRFGIFPDAA